MISDMFIGANDKMTTWVMVALLVLLVVVLLVVPVFSNKKRSKQAMTMHNSLQPGDKIKTVGGIIGTIKEIKRLSPNDQEMVIETGEGDNKSTMTFDIQALYMVLERVPHAPAADTSSVFDEPADVKAEETAPAVEEKVEPESKPEEHAVEIEKAAEPVVTEASENKSEEETAAAVEKTEESATVADEHKPAAPKAPAKKKPVSSAKNSTKK